MMDKDKVINGLAKMLEESKYNDSIQYNPWADTETLEAAIALLKAQELNDDWISRKRLKDEIQYYIDEAGWGEEINKALGWCLEFIDNQGTVKWDDNY